VPHINLATSPAHTGMTGITSEHTLTFTLVSSIAPKPALLFRHFFQVAFYSIWVMFMHAQRVPSPSSASNGNANGHANGHANGNGYPAEKSNGYANGHVLQDAEIWVKPGILEYPGLFLRAILVVRSCFTFPSHEPRNALARASRFVVWSRLDIR
jgi:hypothetical protein